MKNLRNTISLVFILIASSLSAQNTSYKEIFDDPLQYKNCFVNLHFFNVDFASPSTLRAGIGAEFTLNRRLSFSADFDKAIMAIGIDEAIKTSGTSFEAGGVFSFYSNVKDGKIKYSWKELNTAYSMKVSGKVHKQIGVRGGLTYFSSPKDADFYQLYFNSEGIYAGLCVLTTKNKLIHAEGISMKHTDKESHGNFYFDLMLSPAIQVSDNTDYGDVSVKARSQSPNPNIDSLATKHPFGWRVGYMLTNRYPIPLKSGFEIGYRPGLQNNFFFLAKFAISLGFNVGRKAPAANTAQ